MKLYQLNADDENWGKQYKYDIDAGRQWRMPGLKCTTCGETWISTGVQYPLIVPSEELSVMLAITPRLVLIEDFLKLSAMLRKQLDPELPIKPNTALGPLTGTITGESPGTAWQNPWTFFVNDNGIEALAKNNVKHAGVVATQLRSRRRQPETLYEIQIEPRVTLAMDSFSEYSKTCDVCGRVKAKLEQVIIDRATIPSGLDLFRPTNFTTYILATERFREAYTEFGLGGTLFTEVEVS